MKKNLVTDKTIFVLLGIAVLLGLALGLTSPTRAECQYMSETADHGDVIICNGDNLDGYRGTVYSDEITVESGATVVDDIVGGSGNDTIILTGEQPQVLGTIDGGESAEGQGDTLEFNLITSDEILYYQAKDDIASANPDGGTLTWGASTFKWVNFEILVDNLQMIVTDNSAQSGGEN